MFQTLSSSGAQPNNNTFFTNKSPATNKTVTNLFSQPMEQTQNNFYAQQNQSSNQQNIFQSNSNFNLFQNSNNPQVPTQLSATAFTAQSNTNSNLPQFSQGGGMFDNKPQQQPS